MVNMITTLGGWTLLTAVGYIYWWRYTTERAKRRGALSKAEREKRKANEKVDSVGEVDAGAGSGTEKLKNRKKSQPKPKPQSITASSSAVDTSPNASEPFSQGKRKEESDDMAFARQLASAQAGTNLKAPETHNTKVRTNKIRGVKPGASHENLADADTWQSSGPASSAGADGDDDLSPQMSPDLAAAVAASTEAAVADAGISDMLGAPAAGPSTLRLVPSDKPQKQSAPKQAKPAEEAETKKQRQRRKKREAEKAQQAEDEAHRRRLMEKQMKTARTAEGTAKSGQYRTYTLPTNAWTNAAKDKVSEAVESVAETAKIASTQLLDTFDAAPVAKVAENVKSGAEKIQKGTKAARSEAAEAQLDPPSDASRPSLESEPGSSGVASLSGGAHDPVIADDNSSAHERLDGWEDYQIRTLRQQEKSETGWQEVAPRKGKKVATR